jgi:hypothetical protein
MARRTGRFPQLVDPRSSMNGLLLTGSPRFREVSLEERLSLCRLKQSAAVDAETDWSKPASPRNACSVWSTSPTATPCFKALSRSTFAYTCGSEAEKIVATPASSGRFRAASINVRTFLSRNSTDLPPRSCSQNETPPELPS